uniref:PGIP n=1 Tax=Morus alba var. multicaulis TaxID=170012 RepID=D9ZGH9_MORAL|nr:PGIP [Morus alba var. multicaulis]
MVTRISIIYLALLFSTILHASLSERCHPLDKEALLKIKKAFNYPYILVSWDPNTDCCDWTNVVCDNVYNRIISISFSYGDLAGTIPDEIGDLPYLQNILFHKYGNLIGSIPTSIEKLTMLRFLQITWTGISGPIPAGIGNIKSLEFIDFSYNKITGTIPSSIGWLPSLGGLRLDRNELVGPIPDSFGDFQMSDFYLYMSHNKLSGPIPTSMAKKDFSYIDLSRNKLTGDPSPLFGENKRSLLIDLSRNSFSFDLTSVKFSRTLVSLDLNHNKITGSLPAELTELKLNLFNVSYNRLCGKIPVGGNLQRFDYTAYFHNRCLCGSPLPPCSYSEI